MNIIHLSKFHQNPTFRLCFSWNICSEKDQCLTLTFDFVTLTWNEMKRLVDFESYYSFTQIQASIHKIYTLCSYLLHIWPRRWTLWPQPWLNDSTKGKWIIFMINKTIHYAHKPPKTNKQTNKQKDRQNKQTPWLSDS